MIPTGNTDLLNDFTEVKKPSRTYRIKGNRIYGMTDGLEAVRQAVWLILNTERFVHPIYSWNYGVELEGLLGVNPPLVYSLLKQRITEALTQDDRIDDVSDFSFSSKDGTVQVSFTVNTIYGDYKTSKEVTTNV